MLLVEVSKSLRFICNLNSLLAQKGWTQTYLHRVSGVSMTTIRSLTKGGEIERIDRGSTEKILSAMNCSFDELYSVNWSAKCD